MDQHLLSPESAKSPPPIFVGAGVKRTETNDSITDEQKFETRVSRGDTQRGERRGSDYLHAPDSPPSEELYDPPTHRDDGDIAMQLFDDPFSGSTMSPGTIKGDYGYLGGPTREDSDKRSLLSTAKKYDHRQTRLFLLRTGSYRLFLTFLFCVMIAFALKCYEGFGETRILGKTRVRWFNALMIGLSLALGLNLASSLKSYAVILRWSLLTRRYVSLEVFDLILGLETLTKVGKLMVISLPGIRKSKFLKKLPWFREARDDGTKLTWIVCLLWLLVNIGAQVIVASLSLFWPVDPADGAPLMKYGDVVVSDLSKWSKDWKPDNNMTALEESWFAGNDAATYPWFWANETKTDLSSMVGPPYFKVADGNYEYRFINRNPTHEYSQYAVSSRRVRVKASCETLDIKDKEGDIAEGTAAYVEGKRPGSDEWIKYYLTDTLPGSLIWTAAKFELCGPRCTNFTIYQDTDSKEIKNPSLFLCTNTVDEVKGGGREFTDLSEADHDALYGNDAFARIAAGSISWTGYNVNSWEDRQSRTYTRGSTWSPNYEVKASQVEDLLAKFTIGAIAAFDDHGLRYTVKNQNCRPVQGQWVQVDWSWVLGLLGGIVLIQTAALGALLIFANKSIIRDDSFFSLAMLLSPVVNRIGKEGMNLTGDEIKTHSRLRWKRIRYDYKEGENGMPNQVSIFFQGQDMFESRRSWAGGEYI